MKRREWRSAWGGRETDTYSDYLRKTGIRKPTDVLTWHVARPHIDRDKKIYKKAIEAWENNHQRLKYTELPEELCTHKNRTAFLDRFKVVAKDLPYCHTMMATAFLLRDSCPHSRYNGHLS